MFYKTILSIVILSVLFVLSSRLAYSQEPKKHSFPTQYTVIYYNDDKDLSDFLWRISGKRPNFTESLQLFKPKVDRLIRRVQDVLNMYPNNLSVKIYIYPEYKSGDIAVYSFKTNSIRVYADRITDGIFAHEIAHAIISNYFKEPPPRKVQEILAQYVDKHLWSDY